MFLFLYIVAFSFILSIVAFPVVKIRSDKLITSIRSKSDDRNSFSIEQAKQVLVNSILVGLVGSSFFLGTVAFKALVEETSNSKFERISTETKTLFTELKSDIINGLKSDINGVKTDIKEIKVDVQGLKIFQGVATAVGLVGVPIGVGLTQEFLKKKLESSSEKNSVKK
jgi:hypothetical protein